MLASSVSLGLKPWRSISFRLSAILISFFLLVIALGFFGVARLNDFNGVSSNISDVWLPNTRLLGDLNNFSSDFRAAEASLLLATKRAELDAAEKAMADLDPLMAQAQRSYEIIAHDTVEMELYDRFKHNWNDYRRVVEEMRALVHDDRKAEADALYATTSHAAYAAASDTLGMLTNQNVVNAQRASELVDKAYAQARWMIRIAMLLAAAMIAGAVLYIRRAISSPLLDLAVVMRRLARNDTNVEFQGTERGDEIGAMTSAAMVFRNNAVDLMLNQRALAREASMFEEKLVYEQRLTTLQRNFISMVSHEFRTPLTIIDGHAQRLAKIKDTKSPENIAERARRIHAAVLRLNYLIESLSGSSRLLESGAEFYFHPIEVNLESLLHEACELHREIAPDAQIFEDFIDLPPSISADPKLLFQMFSNLLSNAIKYSPDGGPIQVSASSDANLIKIQIRDHGIGVPESDIDQLFTRYFRASNVSGIVGTGIGLYLVRMVAELHRGAVAVESRESLGSVFTVSLPRSEI